MYKQIQWALAGVLTLASPVLFALGLGGASVDSYLNQPLDIRVELISRSGGELQSITAGLASVDDYELLGLSRSALTVPLEFEVVTDSGTPHIRITSRVAVNEPVVQVLVEIVWSHGRMLRQYTLFLDPPTFESAAPPVVVKPASLPAVVETPPVRSKAAVAGPALQAAEPVAPQPDTDSDQSAADPIADSATDEPADHTVEQADDDAAGGEIYGPVASGETLWGIASELSRGSGYSINQTMLALQRKNPGAFLHDNINFLKRGAILRLPLLSEISELTSREAMLEAIRQGEAINTGFQATAPDYGTPTVADSGEYQESVTETVPEPEIEAETGHLELVPPAEKDDTATQGAGQPQDRETADKSIQQELARTEEELVNARQENIYLQDRIQELKAQQQVQQEKAFEVTDSGLAGVESSLAEKRAEDKPEQPVAVTPGGEQQPWYAAGSAWIAGIALLVIVFVIWLLRRRGAGQVETARAEQKIEAVEKSEAEQQVSDEAEDLLRMLDRYEDGSAAKVEAPTEPESEPGQQPEPEPEQESEPEPESVVAQDEETEEADADAEDHDPEVRLDLARAYLSLGDKEAAKSMLDEVLSSGNEAQRTEALQMMKEL